MQTQASKPEHPPRRTKARAPREQPVATRPIPLPRESPRDAARRARYQRAERDRTRRRILALVITGAAILIAIGAGAAITLVGVLSHTAASPAPTGSSLTIESVARPDEPGLVPSMDGVEPRPVQVTVALTAHLLDI